LASYTKGRTQTEDLLQQATKRLMREELTGGWSTLHKEEHQNFDSSPNIIRVIISARMWQLGHVARMGDMRN